MIQCNVFRTSEGWSSRKQPFFGCSLKKDDSPFAWEIAFDNAEAMLAWIGQFGGKMVVSHNKDTAWWTLEIYDDYRE